MKTKVNAVDPKGHGSLAALPNSAPQRRKTIMATKSPERKIYDVLIKATKEGTVPFGYYGPETCRWTTQEEMQRFGLNDHPLVHLDEKGDIDCYFTETEPVTIRPKNEPKANYEK
jgi:hypothetical protein